MTIPGKAMLDPSPSVFGKSIDAECPDEMIRGICEKLDAQVICVKDHLCRNDYKPHDEDWSECGHRKIARLIANMYRHRFELRNQREPKTALSEDTTPCSQRFSVRCESLLIYSLRSLWWYSHNSGLCQFPKKMVLNYL
jgi:hypothetical protein